MEGHLEVQPERLPSLFSAQRTSSLKPNNPVACSNLCLINTIWFLPQLSQGRDRKWEDRGQPVPSLQRHFKVLVISPDSSRTLTDSWMTWEGEDLQGRETWPLTAPAQSRWPVPFKAETLVSKPALIGMFSQRPSCPHCNYPHLGTLVGHLTD